MNGFRTFLASFRFSANRFDIYYRNVVGQGTGYPTADEARRDVALREKHIQASTFGYGR